ncbi:hypothetical protein EMCRGX_G018311 [Ephydatia muelleri]|eukprot:Em0012g720a
MEDLLKCGDYAGLAIYCEQQELKAPDGHTTADVYGTLIGVYLLQNELDHAKLLWQRIPKSIKQSSGEIGDLWEIGKKLWQRDFAAVYPLAHNASWPQYLVPIVTDLVARVRTRVMNLVGKAYSTISITDLCSLLGQTEQEVKQAAEGLEWEFDTSTGVCRPKPLPSPKPSELLNHRERLARLTDIVSFLEN